MNFIFEFSSKKDNEITSRKEDQSQNICATVSKLKESLVEVYFRDRHLTCTYYNDRFNLKSGDIVFVDGKLEGIKGRVKNVSHNFKIKLSDYKRVVGVADTCVSGKFCSIGSYSVTFQRAALPYDKIRTWFKAPESDEDVIIHKKDNKSFNINNLSNMRIDPPAAERGHDYYIKNRVFYIELGSGKGRAIVMGTIPYEVEFDYVGRNISNLVCDCYCIGLCKHEFATMLQLRESLDTIEEKFADEYKDDYFAVVNNAVFFEYVLEGREGGEFLIDSRIAAIEDIICLLDNDDFN